MSLFLRPCQGLGFAANILAQWSKADSTVQEVVENATVDGGYTDLVELW